MEERIRKMMIWRKDKENDDIEDKDKENDDMEDKIRKMMI
jgi:hypothetical protein